MKNRKLISHALAAIAVGASALVSQTHAAVVITIVPSAPTVNVGDPLGVDILVSGLTQALGAFAFNVDYDGTRLALLGTPGYVADPDSKMGDLSNPASNFSTGPAGASVNFDILSGFFLPADELTLFALQGSGVGSFRLGHFDLSALNPGFASISLSGFSLSDYAGTAGIGSTAMGARVCIGGNCANAIPEPTMPLLVMAALSALALTRRQKAI